MRQFISNRRLMIGTVVWLGVVFVWRPSLMEPVWAVVLLLLAALLLVPMALSLIELEEPGSKVVPFLFPAALSLTTAFLPSHTLLASLFVLPWLGLTAVLAFSGARRLYQRGLRPWSALVLDAGLIFLPVGSAWALMARLGIRPLGFSDEIVMLTAVHFHYAGFLLPILCGLAAAKKPGRLATAAVWGVVLGVPLTAVGITASQLGIGFVLETVSAWMTAVSGLLTAGLYLRLVVDTEYRGMTRILWGVTAVCLIVGMCLAALYGSRQLLPLQWLTIPWMRAAHGTVNSIGFALFGLLGWKVYQTGRKN